MKRTKTHVLLISGVRRGTGCGDAIGGLGMACLVAACLAGLSSDLRAQPTVVDPDLAVRTVVGSGLDQPIGMAFLGPNDFFVLEKATGKVKRIRTAGGFVQSMTDVLDLPVNSASERGLLSIALHPKFPRNPGVYLYWTESSTGADSSVLAEVGNPASPFPPGTPMPMGNRVDRFLWNPTAQTLTFDHNLIVLRAFQADAGQPQRGNHDGGVIRFGLDEDGDDDRGRGRRDDDEDDDDRGRGRRDDDDRPAKLYIVVGDLGRRGQMQNLQFGPFGAGNPDDQFGGPRPDNAHLSGVILRLNDDGSTPGDNPFFQLGQALIRLGDVEVGRNIRKVFGYGIRNCFGMALDPKSGDLWTQENGDDSFSEINRVEPGFNGGWIQIMGPVSRIAQFKAIETGQFNPDYAGLQQVRWPPTLIADSPQEALSRLFRLPGSRYTDPVFSWRYEVAPAGIGFLKGRALGRQYEGDLFVGASRVNLLGGYLFRFRLTNSRRAIDVDDPRLADRVADNLEKHNFAPNPLLGLVESESLVFGRDFGVATDIGTGPNGNLFLVSLSNNAIYEVFRPGPSARQFRADLTGDDEVPPRDTRARGRANFDLSRDEASLRFKLSVNRIENVVGAHIHVGPPGVNGPIVAHLFGPAPPGGGREDGKLADGTITDADLTGPLAGQPLSALLDEMRAGNTYVNVHTNDGVAPPDTGPGDFPGGEIRGPIRPAGKP